MRYTVQFQKPTGHWVVLDTQNFMMLGSFRSEEDATVAALRFEESANRNLAGVANRSVA
jgi:hypothetical protein